MRILVLLVAAFALSGCAATVAAPATKPVEPTNRAACKSFETVTAALANRIAEGSDDSNAAEFKTTMGGMGARFDNAALSGDGEVQSRIETLISDLPDPATLLYLDSTTYFADVAAVQRACDADGFPINPSIWK